ncbi:MAG: CNP1-like family protein [Burkholderiales bacterium]|nr:CNP1-like family protein [Burkholderiales bacterium]
MGGALAALLTLTSAGAGGQTVKFGASDDDAAPQRDAESVEPPAYPSEENLVGFFVSAASDFDFFIDAKSIAIDGSIVRYTLVARSPEGVENVSYEAIRCSTDEYRIYAIGHSADRSWAQRRTPWREITPKSVQRWRFALLRDYFCPGGAPIFSVDGGINALRRGRHSLIDSADRF